MRRWLVRLLLIVLVAYLAFTAMVYAAMRREPLEFSRFMMRLPQPFMYITPFPPMWNRARAGSLQSGDVAPDFDLETHNRANRVRLSSLRGDRPVVLIFGSYT